MPSDSFKWFGEGFDGFPKILPDDCTQYTLYIIDARLSDFEVRAQLRKVQAAATTLCKTLLKDFIWQRDGFRLDLFQREGKGSHISQVLFWLTPEGHSFLQGQTSFGDSIEDEWLIVFLLRELSKQFPESWIQVNDSDGEFLLVEAADALPKWLNPEIAENRVWISQGKLFIIPKQPKEKRAHEGGLKLDDALTFIQGRSSELLHIPSVESEAFYRLRKYPEHIKESLHHAVITIPRRLAYILHENAAYISPAVDAFYLRDPIALRPLQSNSPSKLFFPPEAFVTVSAKFTKVGYAQLRGQDYQAPPAWIASTAKRPHMPGQEESEMTGMKVACGFEMLLSDPQNADKKSVREIKLILEDICAGEDILPSDKDISQWERRQDDESWLDINFDDFERELSGSHDPNPSAGFGDKAAQDNLRRMVTRFKRFLDDDKGGAQDAEFLDDMDNDDGSAAESESGGNISDGEDDDDAVDYDEDGFASMMRDMMGLPPIAAPKEPTSAGVKADSDASAREDKNSIVAREEICKVMHDMEAELQEAGALHLEPTPMDRNQDNGIFPPPAPTNGKAATGDVSSQVSSLADDGELNIDFDQGKKLLDRLENV
ncbi:MAG: hypothetical protein Q9201_005256 [Fulgogasparrea decipioides]